MTRPLGAALAFALLLAACDPTHDSQIAALGPEKAGVRQGPLHRPGQPCLVCHDGELGDPARFTVAGTVFQSPSSSQGADGVQVNITDAHGATCSGVVTNTAGNFYVTPQQCDPVFPLRVSLSRQMYAAPSAIMQTLVTGNGTTTPIDGACATCHFDPAGSSSPGHVYLYADDGGTPL